MGMLAASGSYRFLCDADLSMPIEQLSRFLPPQRQNYDVAIGSREIAGAHRFNEPPLRHLMTHVFNLVVRLVAVPGFKDTQCGFKCFTGGAAQRLFPFQRTDGFGFDVEILFLARQEHLRIIEVPIDWYHKGESKVSPLHHALTMLLEIVRLRWNHRRGHYRDC